jgi:hypothetical protein
MDPNDSRAPTVMTPTPTQAGRARHNLPASLIFTPRELKQYRRWQSLCTTLKPTECGLIPTAVEYEDFQQWLRKQDSGYFSDVFDDICELIRPTTSSSDSAVASICQHSIHPTQTGEEQSRCPVCMIEIHINYMKLLTRSLHGANGRPLPFTGTPSEQQENLYMAWSQGKLKTLEKVCELEELSTKEIEWSERHQSGQSDDVQSATKALELYWLETTDSQNTRQCSTNMKVVAFAEDTNFLPGRPIDYFLKRSPRYEPGKYTILYEEEEDDDIISEDSEDYSCVRIFTLSGPTDLGEDPSAAPSENHEQNEDIVEEIEDDDGDSDWEDIESDNDDNGLDGSYISFEEDEETSFIVFSES